MPLFRTTVRRKAAVGLLLYCNTNCRAVLARRRIFCVDGGCFVPPIARRLCQPFQDSPLNPGGIRRILRSSSVLVNCRCKSVLLCRQSRRLFLALFQAGCFSLSLPSLVLYYIRAPGFCLRFSERAAERAFLRQRRTLQVPSRVSPFGCANVQPRWYCLKFSAKFLYSTIFLAENTVSF